MRFDAKELKKRTQERFSNFARVLQGPDWFDNNVHQWLCDWIQGTIQEEMKNMTDDKIIKMAIVMPRGSLKSTFCTKMFPVWMNVQDRFPDGTFGSDLRTLVVTNSAPNARKKLDDIRSIYDTSEIFRGLYPELLPTRDCAWTSERAIINRKHAYPDATYEAAGSGTNKTGSHYNIIIEDDTTAPEKSEMSNELSLPSRDEIERAIGFHKSATPLLVPKGIRIRLVVSTRWGDDDLISYIQKSEDYHVFDIPAKTEEGKRVFNIFYSENTLKDLEEQVGPYMFSCLYLNRPIDASLRTFKPEWFNNIYYTPNELDVSKATKSYRTIAIDPAVSEKDDACETAITEVLHTFENNKSYQYWENDLHGHFNPEEIVRKTLDLADLHHDEVTAILVETNAYQASLKYYLRDEMIRRNKSYTIVPVVARTKKEMRIEALVPYFANSRIKFSSSLTKQVESQLRQFPHGKLVDIIDCFAMHMNMQKQDKKLVQQTYATPENPLSGEAVLASIKAAKRAQRAGSLDYKSMYKYQDPMTGLSDGHTFYQTENAVYERDLEEIYV